MKLSTGRSVWSLVLGSTVASTALVQYQIDALLVELRQRHGNEAVDAALYAFGRVMRERR